MATKMAQKKSSKKYMSLKDLLTQKLQALYDIETELTAALPKMAEAATDADLKEAFNEHATETEKHAERIEQCFTMIGAKASKLKCEGIRGIIDDAEWVSKNVPMGEALDANLIAAAQYAEHYEMAGYESAIQWAELLELTDISDLLSSTLEEEEAASDKLAALSLPINESALALSDDDDDMPTDTLDDDPEEIKS